MFLYFYDREDLKYNFCLATTAEEEISGVNGLELIIPELGHLDFGIVGEPTLMQLAIAEKGLMVLDCVAHGKAGHAARDRDHEPHRVRPARQARAAWRVGPAGPGHPAAVRGFGGPGHELRLGPLDPRRQRGVAEQRHAARAYAVPGP